jgi:hypothetical protein
MAIAVPQTKSAVYGGSGVKQGTKSACNVTISDKKGTI